MKPAKSAPPLTVNGWTLFAHPLFLDQMETLVATVEKLRAKDSVGHVHKNATKRLAAIAKLVSAFQQFRKAAIGV